MDVKSVQLIRDTKFKGQPMIIVCDNEHSFMDNYPGRALPVWDDANELVYYIETNQESSGMSSSDFPYMIVAAEYCQIQSIRVLGTRPIITKFIDETSKTDGIKKYNLDVVSRGFRNTRPSTEPYYK